MSDLWAIPAVTFAAVAVFGWLVLWINSRIQKQMRLEISIKIQNLSEDLVARLDILTEYVEDLEEKIVMVHQDILYMDQDLNNLEERIIRLEYRPGSQQQTTIEAQAVPPRVEMPLRRMREIRRRRRG